MLLLFLHVLLPLPAKALNGKLNINSATAEEIEQLPFMGKNRAQAFVDYRLENGPVESLEEILTIPAIGQSTYEAIRPYIKLAGKSTLQESESAPHQQDKRTTFKVLPNIFTQPGQIMLLPDQVYYETLTNYLHHAEQRIDMAMFLFKITESPQNKPAAIVRELIRARNKGLQVQVLLEKSGYDPKLTKTNKKVADVLEKKGIKVRFDSKSTTSHMKLVVVDSRFCFIGSHNFTHSALAFYHEFSLLIDSAELAKELLEYMDMID